MGHTRFARAQARATFPAALALSLLALSAAPSAAQSAEAETYSIFSGSIAFLNAQPLGSLATGPGFGFDATAAFALDRARRFRVRGDLRANFYGRDTRSVCLSETVGCLIEVDINTDYGSFYAGVGPEVSVPVLGTSLVLGATAGVGNFGVSSSIEGADSQDENLFRTDHYSDTFFAWSAGGQLRVPISAQVSVAFGGHYQYNGDVSYVPEGGVTQNPDGSVNVAAITTDANQVLFTIGVAFHPFRGWTEDLEDEDDGF